MRADARSHSRHSRLLGAHQLLFFARRQRVKHVLPVTPVKIKRVSVS